MPRATQPRTQVPKALGSSSSFSFPTQPTVSEARYNEEGARMVTAGRGRAQAVPCACPGSEEDEKAVVEGPAPRLSVAMGQRWEIIQGCSYLTMDSPSNLPEGLTGDTEPTRAIPRSGLTSHGVDGKAESA